LPSEEDNELRNLSRRMRRHVSNIGAVDSKDEALELAREYERTANSDRDCPPESFVINRRDDVGRYTVREVLDVQ
jgi:hypothetical protein